MKSTCWKIAAAVLLVPAAAYAQDDAEAKQLAQEILDEGSALFDTRNAAAMAATYTEDATLFLVGKDQNTGRYNVDTRNGRSDIESVYRDFFKNREEGTTSKNTVHFARQLGSDLLVIHGEFAPDVSNATVWPFVQVRRKQGDEWLMMSLRLFLVEP